jgi:YD repeat-containing protein
MAHRTAMYYDSRRNLTCVLDPANGLTYYTYDALSRMTSVKNPYGEVTYYFYDDVGALSKRRLGNGVVSYYSYDAAGHVSAVANRKSDLSLLSSFTYQRDAAGNPTSILREDGSVVYYEYDLDHQLTKETQRDGGGADTYA